ncbi:hypothetical protein N7445_000215 [Penicillium cf. griseofulvum]|nr:hypothetical protein N7445_000215 [Penicillium cf. griseofulvum]
MCLSVPSSSLALISLTGFLANLDPPLLNLNSPADISDVSTNFLSPFTLAFDFSASEVTWLGSRVRPEEGRTVNLLERFKAGLSTIEAIKANWWSLCEQRLLDRYSKYHSTILYNRARSIVDPAVIAGTFT